jgi:hypothetical protein
MGTAERTFLTPKNKQESEPTNIPSLDEFDAEIEIYRVSTFIFWALNIRGLVPNFVYLV